MTEKHLKNEPVKGAAPAPAGNGPKRSDSLPATGALPCSELPPEKSLLRWATPPAAPVLSPKSASLKPASKVSNGRRIEGVSSKAKGTRNGLLGSTTGRTGSARFCPLEQPQEEGVQVLRPLRRPQARQSIRCVQEARWLGSGFRARRRTRVHACAPPQTPTGPAGLRRGPHGAIGHRLGQLGCSQPDARQCACGPASAAGGGGLRSLRGQDAGVAGEARERPGASGRARPRTHAPVPGSARLFRHEPHRERGARPERPRARLSTRSGCGIDGTPQERGGAQR